MIRRFGSIALTELGLMQLGHLKKKDKSKVIIEGGANWLKDLAKVGAPRDIARDIDHERHSLCKTLLKIIVGFRYLLA